MRPTSEVHSALMLADGEISRMAERYAAIKAKDEDDLTDEEMDAVNGLTNLEIARDVLAWVMGNHWSALTDGANPWLAAYLLDDPPKLDSAPPENN